MLKNRRERIWLAVTIIAAAIMYLPTFAYFWQKWSEDSQYNLGYLAPLVCAYFTWKKWPEVKKLKRSPSVLGLVLIGFALIFHLAGVILDVTGPSGFSVIICLVGYCLYFHGKALVRTLGFPLAYSVFMIPFPGGVVDVIGFPMQLWASAATAGILSTFGMEVARSGVNLSVPGFDFQVALACSGMSSLVALVGVTAVFAYVTKLPASLKWVLFLMSLPIALAANVVRITTIALVGYQWGPDAAMNIFHEWSSPILFMAAIVFLLLLNWGFEWLSERRSIS